MNVRSLLKQKFKNRPTEQQEEAFGCLEAFLTSNEGDECFVLKGYAGTGKTTIIAAIVEILPIIGLKYILLAPTGRAAKVIANYSGKKAFTIHKKIYRKRNALTPEMSFDVGQNNADDTLFIVDEASMISNETGDFGHFSLLYDLIKYVYNGKNCRLMFVGDVAQLPPVGSLLSPALDEKLLDEFFGLNLFHYELTAVVRHEKDSGILDNATRIRELIRNEKAEFPKFSVKGFNDIYRMTGEKLAEGIQYAYDKYGIPNTLVVCRSNKSANSYNQQIRNRILYREEELNGGDFVMVVRNNYYWLPPESSNAFIANGDIARIRKVRTIHEVYGFRFADVVLEFIDYPEQVPLDCKLLLDTLYMDTPNLAAKDNKRLFDAVMEDYQHISDKRLRSAEIKTNPYYNALQVKFSFAVTCHKAQGGQWDIVFVDQGYLTDEMVNQEFLRWLYTAATRATKELFLINFSDLFFED